MQIGRISVLENERVIRVDHVHLGRPMGNDAPLQRKQAAVGHGSAEARRTDRRD
jgi:hypothetical protein